MQIAYISVKLYCFKLKVEEFKKFVCGNEKPINDFFESSEG